MGNVITRFLAAAGLTGLLALSACASAPPAAPAAPPAPPASAAPPSSAAPTTDPAALAANELEAVPVLMYHRIVAKPRSVYDRTPEDFRAELVRLATENYVPITAAQYTGGTIDIPAGTHPVVLTFDDGDRSQFALAADGTPAPGTAVAILLEVAKQYPAFTPAATFYVNTNPFGDKDGTHTLPWLRAHGMDVGNHTLTHANLKQATPDHAQQEIAQGDQAIRQADPGADPVTIALPFGIHPKTADLALRGGSGGVTYQYRGVFLVGANPAPSPYAADFDPLRIPRIRSQGATGTDANVCSTAWLDKLAADPAHRYTSDGMPDRIAYPRGTGEVPAEAFRARSLAY